MVQSFDLGQAKAEEHIADCRVPVDIEQVDSLGFGTVDGLRTDCWELADMYADTSLVADCGTGDYFGGERLRDNCDAEHFSQRGWRCHSPWWSFSN